MNRLRIRAGLLFGIGLSMALAGGQPAAAAPGAVPAAAAQQASPAMAPVASPVTPNVGGISVGAAMSIVDAKCRETGVKCTRGTRKTKTYTLDRIRVEFPAPSPFTRAYVTAKGGTVIAIKGSYRADDQTRIETLDKGLGTRAHSRGSAVWTTAATGVVTQLSPNGRSIRYVDTKAANAKGIPLKVQDFVKKVQAPLSVAPEPQGSLRPVSPSMAQMYAPPSATTTQTLRIPVKITLKQLQCWVEDDPVSIIWGDDPYLYIVGTHTGPEHGKPWFVKKTFGSDVEAGGIIDLNLPIFEEGDQEHRSLTYGEALGVQFSLFEEDTASFDDEIDFGYPIVDYAFALANQGKTGHKRQTLQGDGAEYYLTYEIEVGTGVPDPKRGVPMPPKYRSIDAKTFAGSYSGKIGDQVGELTLTHVASYDPTYPTGVVFGSIKDGTTTMPVQTQRLQGDNVELLVKYPTGNPAILVGYLIGSGTKLEIAGTLVRDGVTRGVLLDKK